MYDFVDPEDGRNSESDLSFDRAYKLWRTHNTLYGLASRAYIELDGVEIAPLED